MKDWADYLDENGLVVQKKSLGGDGGDSLNRTFASAILSELTGREYPANVVSAYLRCAEGRYFEPIKYRRSWHINKWYSDWDRMSRDQLTPLVIHQGLTGDLALRGTFKDHLKRLLLFTYNTRRNHVYRTYEDHLKLSTPDVKWDYSWKIPDFTGPEFWALYVRGFNFIIFYPLLFVLDFHTLLGSVVVRLRKSQDDVINHALILEYAKVRMDTWVMKLARMVTPRSLLQKRLDQFFGKEIEPPINELYRNLK